MSKYRYIYTEFWKDIYIKKLNEIEKLAYIYILTNPDSMQSGIHLLDLDLLKISIPSIDINNILSKFETDDKIKFNKDTNEIAIKNWTVWNYSESPKVVKCISKEFDFISDKSLINYVYTDEILYNMEMILILAYINSKKKDKPPYECCFYKYYSNEKFFKKVLTENFSYKDYIPEDVVEKILSENKK